MPQEQAFQFDAVFPGGAIVHDIELAGAAAGYFDRAFLAAYGSQALQGELDTSLRKGGPEVSVALQKMRREFLDHLDETVVSEVVLEVLQSDVVSRQDYLKVLTHLTDLAQKLVDRGRFDEALNIYNTLYPQTLAGKFQQEALGTIEFFFRSEPFVAGFLNALKVWGRQNRDASIKLARALRSQLIGPLLDRVLGEEDSAMRKFYLAILVEFRGDIVDEVVKRLGSNNPTPVRNLLYLLRKCGNYRQTEAVKQLVEHPDKRIHTAAVRTLLHFRVKDGVPPLRLYFQSTDEEIKAEAIELAGTYKVQEAVPDLVEILEEKGVLGGKIAEKISAIRSLGAIGDARAVGTLEKIAQARGLLRRGQREEMKMEVFRNLDKYPLEAIEGLLKIGAKSSNEEIQTLSQKYLRKLFTDRQNRNKGNA